MATHFYLENRPDKNGNAPIRVSICVCGARFITSTGQKIPSDKWDAKKEQVKKGCSNTHGITYSTINTYLSRISHHFAEFENKIISDERKIKVIDLKNEFAQLFGRRAKQQGNKELSFFELWDKYVNDVGGQNQWTEGTYKKLKTVKRHLLEWNKDVIFNDLSEEGLTEFMRFLLDDLEMRNSTAAKNISILKWFLRWATTKGFNTETAFETFRPKLKTADRAIIFLDWEEIMKTYHYQIPTNGTVVTLTDSNGIHYEKTIQDAPAIEKARDIFCFCCFTSLRYSDVANLKKSNIVKGRINLTTVKTAETINITLNKFALAILAKYEDKELPGNKALPVMTNQRMNIYIKELCELCEINQPITQTYYKGNKRYEETTPKYALIGTHTGRRSLISNALMLGVPPQTVMKWTGHRNYNSMRPYIDITDAAEEEGMNVFNNLD